VVSKTVRLRVLSVLLLGLVSAFSGAAEPQERVPAELVLGVENSWPPYADENGQGVSADIVRAAFSAVGRPVTFKVRPYARVLLEVASGALDGGFNVTRQASTEPRFIFGEIPILVANASYYFPADHVIDFNGADRVPDGTRVGLIIGYEYGDSYERYRSRIIENRVGRQRQIIRMLMAGRIDAGVMFDRVASYTLRGMDLPKGAVVKGPLHHRSDIYVVFSKVKSESQKNARDLDRGLKIIKDSGLYADIIKTSKFVYK
jgi:polar amino acid transport system substrate-binding protein